MPKHQIRRPKVGAPVADRILEIKVTCGIRKPIILGSNENMQTWEAAMEA